MKLGGLQKITLSDFPGKVAAIVFTKGCNFNCPYCHNRELISMTGLESADLDPLEFYRYIKRQVGKLTGIVVSGGEPTLHKELPAFFRKIKDLGLKTKLDTNGSRPDMIAELVDANLVDYIAMDIKAPFEKYDLLAGAPIDIPAIEQSIRAISASGVPHHFRTTWDNQWLTTADIERIRGCLPADSTFVVQPCRKVSG